MITFGELSQNTAAFIIAAVLFIVVLIALMFCMSIAEKAGKKYIILGGTLLFFEYTVYLVLYRSYYGLDMLGLPFLTYLIDNTPAALIVLLIVMSSILAITWMFNFIKWDRRNITLISVKEAFDDMYAGIVCYNEAGVPVLVNPKMEELSEYVTRKPLLDGNRLWKDIQNNNLRSGCEVIDQGNTILLRIPNGKIFKLEQRRINVDGVNLKELFATDITKVYTASIELREGNERLKRMNDRMRNLNDTITRVTIEKEILNMKVRVHDNLGQSLLKAKRYLVSGEGSLPEIIENWKENVKLIDSESDVSNNDDYKLMFKTAKDVGVNMVVKGMLPQDQERKRIVSTAMHECITNTIRHAGGNELYISIIENRGETIVRFSNNGKAPDGPVELSGGLGMLHSMVEDYGGTMEVETSPEFLITIKI